MEDNHIGDERARAFAAALRKFEQDSDVSRLSELFADSATLERLDARGERTDPEAFWREYREQFSEIRTTFFNAVEGADQVALDERGHPEHRPPDQLPRRDRPRPRRRQDRPAAHVLRLRGVHDAAGRDGILK
jgi:hypothetical protein